MRVNPSREYAPTIRRLREALFYLKLTRFEILLTVAVWAVLSLPQGQDLLIAMAEDDSPSRFVLFHLSLLAWALSSWHWSRTLLQFRYPDSPPESAWVRGWRSHLPRALGLAAYVVAAASLWRARGLSEGAAAEALRNQIILTLVSGLLFYAFMWARRRLFRTLVRTSLDDQFERVLQLDTWTLGLLGLSFAIGLASFVLALCCPVWLGQRLGAEVLLLLWGATWAPLAGLIAFLATRWGLPALTVLFAAAVLFSPYNDNHALRATEQGLEPARRPALTAALQQWRQAHPDEEHPFVVVSTAGGGIRAAYWTATVLGRLEDTLPGFHDSLFAVSGVSGGSIGTAVWRALLADHLAAPGKPLCDPVRVGRPGFEPCAQAILGQDFLGPAAAGMLYPDLVQRFFPLAFLPDRAQALEEAWEGTYREVTGSERFALPVSALARPSVWPVVLFNTTSVELGERFVASNAALPGGVGRARDLLAILGRDLPLSAAAGASARFPGVSPAGTLVVGGRLRDRVVDGGYYENYGAATAREVVEEARRILGERRPILAIQISSDPLVPLDFAGSGQVAHPAGFAHELLSPLRALLAAREARGVEAVGLLRALVEAEPPRPAFFHFRMCNPGKHEHKPPLGWRLSERSRREIAAFLPSAEPAGAAGDALARCRRDNYEAFARIREALGG